MSGQQNPQAEALLAEVSGILDELNALEESYKAAKEQRTADLASNLKRLAEASDTLAVGLAPMRHAHRVTRPCSERLGGTG